MCQLCTVAARFQRGKGGKEETLVFNLNQFAAVLQVQQSTQPTSQQLSKTS